PLVPPRRLRRLRPRRPPVGELSCSAGGLARSNRGTASRIGGAWGLIDARWRVKLMHSRLPNLVLANSNSTGADNVPHRELDGEYRFHGRRGRRFFGGSGRRGGKSERRREGRASV